MMARCSNNRRRRQGSIMHGGGGKGEPFKVNSKLLILKQMLH
jgi:hypothetical protein